MRRPPESTGPREPTVEIVSDELYHYVAEQRRYYARVTGITGLLPKGEGFDRWLASRGGYDNAVQERDAAGESGTRVHRAIEELVRGGKLRCDDFTPEEWKKLVGFRAWWLVHQPKPLLKPESLVYSKSLEVAGHPDLVAEIRGKHTVVDYKTGNYLYDSHEIQIEAYGRIIEEQHGIRNATRALLHLSPRFKSGYGFKEFEPSDQKFAVFQALRTVFRYQHGDNGPMRETVPETLSLVKR